VTTSQKAIDQLKLFEGYKDKAYRDVVGKWTCGFGHTLGVQEGTTCIPEVADEWLRGDVAPCERAIGILIRRELTQGQFDACVDFCYNLGLGNFTKSTLLSLMQKGDMHGASLEFSKWNLAGGKPFEGLTLRRHWEFKRFLGLI
jgi:lysozyme